MKAIITGVTGQDGSFLSEFLLEKGYEVHGVVRRSSVNNFERIEHLLEDDNFHLHYGDLTDSLSVIKILKNVRPQEIYNLAAQSHVQVSFDVPEYTANVDAVGVLRILEAVRLLEMEEVKIYQASTSELFGKVVESPQKETTPFYPYSPYAVAKQYAYWIVRNYREAYNIFASNGILFNHESERRGENFVTRKISKQVSEIKLGLRDKIQLGNLDSLRDRGYAKDYVESMWLILQHDTPDDFVIATGEQHSVREFCTLAFKFAGIEIYWKGKGINEKGYELNTDRLLVEVNKDYFRPTDVTTLLGDPTKSINALKWNPTKTSFEELVKIMVDYDMNMIKRKLSK